MSVYVCPSCGRVHSVEEFMESRFCRSCGRFLTHRHRRIQQPECSTADASKAAGGLNVADEDGVGESKVEGFMALFPYTPYPEQVKFMEDANRILSGGGVMVAEACNGFGKTVCALAVALSLGRRVIYATRTHEQVRQVLREVERINVKAGTDYTAVNLASRQNLCLNEVCRRLPPIEAMETCKVLRRMGRCPYKVDFGVGSLSDVLPPVLSTRSLLRIGRMEHVCPYYLARRLAEDSVVVVAPYLYIFNEAIRARVNLEVDGKILIFDEAHNADKIGQDVLSDVLSERGLNNARRELHAIDAPSHFIDDLREYLDAMVSEEPTVKFGNELREDLERVLDAGLPDFVESMEPLVDEVRAYKIGRGLTPICHLNGLLRFLSLVGSGGGESYAAIYRRSPSGMNIIEYRCLDPSLAVKPVVDEAYAVLMMSGTLSPLNLFTEIIGLSGAEVRTYSAIARPENVRTFIDMTVTTRFKERGSEMLRRYGERILKLIQRVPNGVLIFFPQRGLMMEALRNWIQNGFVKRRGEMLLLGGKRVFIEGERAYENARIVDEYKASAKSGDGAVLLAVFRGRNAEGSNFPYEEARGIFLVGLPYADYHDPLVRAQIQYFNGKEPRLGERWYIMDAFRAANQAMGRGIRHRDDWCNFFLMDRRYSSYWRLISKWAIEGGVERLNGID